MLTNETTSKLHEMHLGAMAEAFATQWMPNGHGEKATVCIH